GSAVQGKALGGLDRAVVWRQVADVTVGGKHLVAGAEILIDRLGLGDRFDNDNVHERVSAAAPAQPSGRPLDACAVGPSANRRPGTWWMAGGVSNARPEEFGPLILFYVG